jgi:LPS-assembly lipoprotein
MKYLFATLITLYLTACGFTPVYKNSSESTTTVSSALNQIEIATIPNREGQVVRNHLIDRLYIDGYPSNPQYKLVVSPIQERLVEIGIDKDDEASRAQIRESATMRLINIDSNQVVLSRTVRSVSGFNILAGQFTTFVTQEDARQQALKALAEDIIINLELYFAT